jgi:hypothetical protein
VLLRRSLILRLLAGRRRGLAGGVFTLQGHQLLKLATIQPYAPALLTIVDLDSLTLAHHQLNIFTSRALHNNSLIDFVLTQ